MQTHRKAVSFAALLMATSVLLTGCASQEIQARKAAIAAASATQPKETPAPTPKPTAVPIDRWSLLDNLPDFAVGTLPAPIITWVDGLPLGENPLTYEDGQHIDGLFSNASGGSIQLSDVSVEDLKDTPVNVRMNMTLSVLDDTATPTSNSSDASSDTSVTDFCLHTKGSGGGQAFYYQIGYNGDYPMDILNGALAIENNLTFGEAFDNGLYYSSATPDEFAGYPEEGTPNSFVDGRNLLFLSYAAVFAKQRGITDIITGVSQSDFSGYPDCRDMFIKSLNTTLCLAMDYQFDIITPLMWLDKKETWALADELGAFDIIRNETLTCYNGIIGDGCGHCPSCKLRKKGLDAYLASK